MLFITNADTEILPIVNNVGRKLGVARGVRVQCIVKMRHIVVMKRSVKNLVKIGATKVDSMQVICPFTLSSIAADRISDKNDL